MQDFPHRYSVTASGAAAGNVRLESGGLPALESAPPAEFGGPGDHWSPETLLAAAVADCFILTFRAVAKSSQFVWTSVSCDVEAILDRIDRVTRFTEMRQSVVLEVPPGTDERRARSLIEKAGQVCLVSNSLNATKHIDASIRVTE